jgi:hypothetical protein
MIRIFLGNVGSGKTISIIRELVENKTNPYYLHTYSNIITKKKGKYALPNNTSITRDMLIKKEVTKVKKDGTEEYKTTFNKEFWTTQKGTHPAFNIVIDEAHTVMNARSAMSKQNKVMGDFLALIRKIANNPNSEATLTLISQIDSRIDIIAREMCTEVRYHIGLYDKRCKKCGAYWSEHSEMSDFQKHKTCMICGSYNIEKFNLRILVHFFQSMTDYQNWKYDGIDTTIKTIIITNIQKYFPYYDTFQMDDLISED